MRFKDGILRQPEMLATSHKAVMASLANIYLSPWRQGTIGFVGVGGSLNTALAGALSARTRGLRAIRSSLTELLDGSIDVADAFIVLSGSGQKPRDRRSTPLAAGQTGDRDMQGCRKSTCKVPQRGRGNRGPLPEQPVRTRLFQRATSARRLD